MIIRIMFCIANMSAITTAVAEEFQFRADFILGSSYELTVISSNEVLAFEAHEAALAEITRLENIFSTWKPNSEISQLNAVSDFTASQELFDFLVACEVLSDKTENALSCRIGKLIDSWRVAQRNNITPDKEMLAAQAKEIAETTLEFESATRRIHRPDNIVIAVDAMAKGLILDRASERALNSSPDVTGIILNIGGDIKIDGDVSIKAPRIGIAGPYAADNEAPMETVLVNSGGVASSGGGMRDVEIAGRAYSHILDPRTGMPQASVSVTSVVAPTAFEADALATAFSVLGVGRSLDLANTSNGVEAVIITAGGGRFASDGWSSLLAPVQKMSAAVAGTHNPWPEGYKFSVEYEVPKIDTGNYEAPYIAAWITDQNKQHVRSLLLLGDSPRWVEENYRYWHRYGRKHPALLDTLAQPTRMPGRYRLLWDGRNETGSPVSQGAYILNIEASREHGGHSYTAFDVQLSDGPMEAIIPAKDEIGEVVLHYGADE